jgi:antitoxin (DNA-binding transcriptional repressor) of toxin-antitoxin stability system
MQFYLNGIIGPFQSRQLFNSHYLAEYVDQIKHETIIVTEDGKPIAALSPLEGADMETIALSTNPKFASLIERSRARDQKEGRLSAADTRKLFDEQQ